MFLKWLLFFNILLLAFIAIKAKEVTYEIISFSSKTDPSEKNVDINLELKQIDRVTSAIYGSIDLRTNLTDKTTLEAKVYFSPTGGNDFVLSPFGISKESLSEFLNVGYKMFFKKYIEKCTTNYPKFTTFFVPPLTPRHVEFNGCIMKSDSLPAKPTPGYYKTEATISGEVNAKIDFMLKID